MTPTVLESTDLDPIKNAVIANQNAYLPIGLGILAIVVGYKVVWKFIKKGANSLLH